MRAGCDTRCEGFSRKNCAARSGYFAPPPPGDSAAKSALGPQPVGWVQQAVVGSPPIKRGDCPEKQSAPVARRSPGVKWTKDATGIGGRLVAPWASGNLWIGALAESRINNPPALGPDPRTRHPLRRRLS